MAEGLIGSLMSKYCTPRLQCLNIASQDALSKYCTPGCYVLHTLNFLEREREIERDFYFCWKCIWEIRTDNPSLAVKILNDTPRPNVPSQKALLEIASDNHSRIFITLLSHTVFINSNHVYCIYPHLSHKHACLNERERKRGKEK